MVNEPPIAPGPADDLQFNRVEPAVATTGAQQCVACHQPIVDEYYALNDMTLCPACHAQVMAPPPGNSFTRVLKATILGIGAGLLGAAVWFAIRRATNYEIGLVAILVGFLVGKAVRKGSGNRGGIGYQILAVVLTYCGIAANYVPDIVESILAQDQNDVVAAAPADPAPGAAGNQVNNPPAQENRAPKSLVKRILLYLVVGILSFAFALALPFLAGVQNIIGLLIIGFALWEAWKFNARRQLPVSGPYRLAAPAAP